MKRSRTAILPNGWLPMSAAEKDGSVVVALVRQDLAEFTGRPDLKRWAGAQLPVRHPGIVASHHDIGWNIVAPGANGGWPDSWFIGWRHLEPAPWEPQRETQVRRFLDVSTGHLRIETRETMDRGGDFGSDIHLIFDPHGHQSEYGWWLWAGKRDQYDMVEKMPPDLRDVIKHAWTQGCDWICLDRDAEPIAELPFYSDSREEQLRFERSRAAILAGLRLIQAGETPPSEIEGASETATEIDLLCEEINLMDEEGDLNSMEHGPTALAIAGLRVLQRHEMPPAVVMGIATDEGRIEPLDGKEIDALCEWLNLGPDRPAPKSRNSPTP